MPIMDGFEACKKIRSGTGGEDIQKLFQNDSPRPKKGKFPLIIALSALIDNAVFERGIKAGFDDYSKPFHNLSNIELLVEAPLTKELV
jgi:CheY-like chemotaxis protein